MKFIFLIVLISLTVSNCYSERFLEPKKYDYQEEVFVHGGVVLISNKINSVAMYKTMRTFYRGNCSFRFEITNRSDKPINFHYSNLSVEDQFGRKVDVLDKQELISIAKSKRSWSRFFSGVVDVINYTNASKAGDVDYSSHTSGNFNANVNSNIRSYGSTTCVNSCISGNNHSTTSGTIHVEAFKQQAINQVNVQSLARNEAIDNSYKDKEYYLQNHYIDSMTVFPGETYAANFQIYVNKHKDEDLKYLIFKYNIDGDEHIFCFNCEKKENEGKWYRFGI